MLLLDTHAWVWFMQGNNTFQRSTIDEIEKCIQSRSLYIAAISQWEVAMLIEKSRIVLNEPTLSWIQKSTDNLHLKIIPLCMDVAVESSRLPGNFHGDPADRMIVASARIHQLSIVTRDAKILAYAQENHVKAMGV